MIPVERVQEPTDFDVSARQKGITWLSENPNKPPKDLWSPFRPALAEAFKYRCGYAAIEIPYSGTVDHFLSCRHHRELAYEWSNYRYSFGSINSRKKNADNKILDPFEIQPDWFEIVIPGFLLKPTAALPPALHDKALDTIRILALNGQEMIDVRLRQYLRYKEGKITLPHLFEIAPLVAKAMQSAGL